VSIRMILESQQTDRVYINPAAQGKTTSAKRIRGAYPHRVKPNTVYLASRAPMPGGVGAASAILSKPYWG
jgi:hypothetical protein